MFRVKFALCQIFVAESIHVNLTPLNLAPLKFDTAKICDDSHMAAECGKINCACVHVQNFMGSSSRCSCVRESRNAHNRYAMAVEKNGTVVRHLPRKVSRVGGK